MMGMKNGDTVDASINGFKLLNKVDSEGECQSGSLDFDTTDFSSVRFG